MIGLFSSDVSRIKCELYSDSGRPFFLQTGQNGAGLSLLGLSLPNDLSFLGLSLLGLSLPNDLSFLGLSLLGLSLPNDLSLSDLLWKSEDLLLYLDYLVEVKFIFSLFARLSLIVL